MALVYPAYTLPLPRTEESLESWVRRANDVYGRNLLEAEQEVGRSEMRLQHARNGSTEAVSSTSFTDWSNGDGARTFTKEQEGSVMVCRWSYGGFTDNAAVVVQAGVRFTQGATTVHYGPFNWGFNSSAFRLIFSGSVQSTELQTGEWTVTPAIRVQSTATTFRTDSNAHMAYEVTEVVF